MTDQAQLSTLKLLVNKMRWEFENIGNELTDAEDALHNRDSKYDNINLLLGAVSATDVRLKHIQEYLNALKILAKI